MKKINSRLLTEFEAFVTHLPDVEYIDKLLADVPQGRRADYMILRRNVIIEQKYTRQEAAAYKRVSLEKRFLELTGKPNYEPGKILAEMSKLNEMHRRDLFRIINRHTNFVKEAISDANSQINGTKQLLNLSNTHGLLIILNDHIDGEIHPAEIEWRAVRELERLVGPQQRKYDNVWSVLVISSHAEKDSILTNSVDVSVWLESGQVWQPPPIASIIANHFNSKFSDRKGETLGNIPASISWPLINNSN